VVDTALQAIGTPYRWGGTAANGFDCSGLIQFAYNRHGIALPRRSGDQLRVGRPLSLVESGLQPGDILGFSEEAGGNSSHVGLYIGDGDFIHSSSSGVRISELGNPYWQVRLMAARRILR
jgi:cell wall-associated NlpC family hydrolase